MAAFVAAEYAARLYVRTRGSFVRERWRRIHNKIDQQALPLLEPEVRWVVNELGERGDPEPAERDHLYKVLTLVEARLSVRCSIRTRRGPPFCSDT